MAQPITRCPTGHLRAHFVPTATADEPQTADHGAAVVQLTNAGSTPCTINGYPRYILLDEAHHLLSTRVIRDSTVFTADPKPHPLTLAPGSSVYSELTWASAPNTPGAAGPCLPVSYLQVWPPKDTQPLLVPFDGPRPVTVCGGVLTTIAFGSQQPTLR